MWGTVTLGKISVMAFATSSRQYSRTSSLAAINYLLRYEYIPDVLEKRGPFREGHLGLAKALAAEGKCLSGGPTGEPNMQVPTGALFVFTDLETATMFVEKDPYVSGGIVTSHTIEEWNVLIQKE